MNKTNFFISLLLAVSLLLVQVGEVFAAPATQAANPVDGTVQRITLESDPTTGVTTVIINLLDENQVSQNLRVSLETAVTLGLVALDGDGNPMINDLALGQPLEVESATIIPDVEEDQHPVGSALATFFSDIEGLDYEAIMRAHEEGLGFGVIAQALWLTTKFDGNADIFEAILQAKQTGDYSAFILEDGTTPSNWGQFKKAILNKDKKNSVGVVMSNANNNGNGSENEKNNDNNANGNNDGNGNGNNGIKDKDKNNAKNK